MRHCRGWRLGSKLEDFLWRVRVRYHYRWLHRRTVRRIPTGLWAEALTSESGYPIGTRVQIDLIASAKRGK